jgi:hypothetical protein
MRYKWVFKWKCFAPLSDVNGTMTVRPAVDRRGGGGDAEHLLLLLLDDDGVDQVSDKL